MTDSMMNFAHAVLGGEGPVEKTPDSGISLREMIGFAAERLMENGG